MRAHPNWPVVVAIMLTVACSCLALPPVKTVPDSGGKDSFDSAQTLPEVTTVSGDHYFDVRVTKLTSNSVTFFHKDGAAEVSIDAFDEKNLDLLVPGFSDAVHRRAAELESAQQIKSTVGNRNAALAEAAPKSPFTLDFDSDGDDWRKSSVQSKEHVCQALAEQSTKGCSKRFFMNAFEGFYATSDPKILKTKLADIFPVFEAASAKFSPEQRAQ